MTTSTATEPKPCCRRRLRTAITLLLGLAFVIGAGLLRYSDDSGLPEEIFRSRKINWEHEADVVILGDSRSYIGVSPDDLATTMSGSPRVLNFGFNACIFYEDYLTAGHRVLDPKSAEPRIILCVTPRTLTPEPTPNDGFHYARNREKDMNWLEKTFDRAFIFFKPMEPKDLGYGIMPFLRKKHFYREFHANGWMASDRTPPKTGSGLREYRNNVFNDKQVDPEVVARVIRFTRAWTADGIRVYALRPPTCAGMVELENELSGFDETAFRARFEEAGGIWLPVNQTAYVTFDDSHLNRDSAVRFSHDLGKLIRNDEAAESKSAQPQD